jgi:3',5'-nucleoside bisphosphate phosphatase
MTDDVRPERDAARLGAVLEAGDAVDLHSHSRHSDGDWTPTELIADASRLGLRLLSLTDHDTVSGQIEARSAAADADLLFLTGMEVSLSVNGRLYHVLGYDHDPASPTWQRFAELRQTRRERYDLAQFEQLGAKGYAVSPDLARDAEGRLVPGPLAVALQRGGHAPTIEAAHQLIRGLGLHQPIELTYQDVFEFAELLGPEEAVFSVAHPGRDQAGVSVRLTEEDLATLVRAIPLVALEATHPYHQSADVAHFASLAAQHGLAVTCGSDAHGLRHRRPLLRHPAVVCQDFLELIRARWLARARTPVEAGGTR